MVVVARVVVSSADRKTSGFEDKFDVVSVVGRSSVLAKEGNELLATTTSCKVTYWLLLSELTFLLLL